MRYFLALGLMAFTPIFSTHEDSKKTDQEFRNLENTVQDQQFSIRNSTPVLSELKDGQIVIFSSGTVNKLLFRSNQEIYAVNASCITVRR